MNKRLPQQLSNVVTLLPSCLPAIMNCNLWSERQNKPFLPSFSWRAFSIRWEKELMPGLFLVTQFMNKFTYQNKFSYLCITPQSSTGGLDGAWCMLILVRRNCHPLLQSVCNIYNPTIVVRAIQFLHKAPAFVTLSRSAGFHSNLPALWAFCDVSWAGFHVMLPAVYPHFMKNFNFPPFNWVA